VLLMLRGTPSRSSRPDPSVSCPVRVSDRDHSGAQCAARIEADTDFSRVWPATSALLQIAVVGFSADLHSPDRRPRSSRGPRHGRIRPRRSPSNSCPLSKLGCVTNSRRRACWRTSLGRWRLPEVKKLSLYRPLAVASSFQGCDVPRRRSKLQPVARQHTRTCVPHLDLRN